MFSELASDLHHYRHRFSMPGIPWPMPIDKLWYSFDIGPVHFIRLVFKRTLGNLQLQKLPLFGMSDFVI